MAEKVIPYGAVIVLDDVEHPVVWGQVSARQVGEMRMLFGCTPRDLARFIDEDAVDLPELAALVYLSQRQAGEELDPAKLMDEITEGMTVKINGLAAPVPSVAEDADPEA